MKDPRRINSLHFEIFTIYYYQILSIINCATSIKPNGTINYELTSISGVIEILDFSLFSLNGSIEDFMVSIEADYFSFLFMEISYFECFEEFSFNMLISFLDSNAFFKFSSILD